MKLAKLNMVKLLGLKTKDSEMSVDMHLETASMSFFSVTFRYALSVPIFRLVFTPLCFLCSFCWQQLAHSVYGFLFYQRRLAIFFHRFVLSMVLSPLSYLWFGVSLSLILGDLMIFCSFSYSLACIWNLKMELKRLMMLLYTISLYFIGDII